MYNVVDNYFELCIFMYKFHNNSQTMKLSKENITKSFIQLHTICMH